MPVPTNAPEARPSDHAGSREPEAKPTGGGTRRRRAVVGAVAAAGLLATAGLVVSPVGAQARRAEPAPTPEHVGPPAHAVAFDHVDLPPHAAAPWFDQQVEDAAPAPVSAPVPAPPASAAESDLAGRINAERANAGLAPLAFQGVLRDQARAWSTQMATAGRISHHPDLTAEAYRADSNWLNYGENVGVGGDVGSIHAAFMASQAHRANVLGDFNQVGVGIVESGGQLWVTVRFLKS